MGNKRSFVRTLWGDCGSNCKRREKVSRDIERCLKSNYSHEFRVYVFGKDNASICEKFGLDYVMVNDDPVLWDLDLEFYRHKLEALRFASYDYDEFVYLDWDCYPIAKLENPWESLGKKEIVQANLFQYRTKKCLWRDSDMRKVCNGGFLYIRGRSIPGEIIRVWDNFRAKVEEIRKTRNKRGLDLRLREKCLSFDDEPAISKYVDEIFGGWVGLDRYYDLFEPEICKLRRNSPYPPDLSSSSNQIFFHDL